MELSKLKSSLLAVVEKYNGKQFDTREIRINVMAHDCFNAIQQLESELAVSRRNERVAREVLKQYQVPKLVIQEQWEPSRCPRCKNYFSEYEPCDDGYYQRAYSLERCPYCGQRITWWDNAPQDSGEGAD